MLFHKTDPPSIKHEKNPPSPSLPRSPGGRAGLLADLATNSMAGLLAGVVQLFFPALP